MPSVGTYEILGPANARDLRTLGTYDTVVIADSPWNDIATPVYRPGVAGREFCHSEGAIREVGTAAVGGGSDL